MKSFYELQQEGIVKPMLKNPRGYKIPKDDLEILTQMCRNSEIAKRVLFYGERQCDPELTTIFNENKHGGSEGGKPLIVDEKKFEELFQVNALYRGTFNDEFDINQFLNSKVEFRIGVNGSGIYFSENDPKYSLNFLLNTPSKATEGHFFKVALNPNANLVDKMMIYKVRGELISAINHGCYADGEKLNLKCDPQVLINLLQSDTSLVALLLGASAVYIPYRNSTPQGFWGHYVLLDKSAVAVTKDTTHLDTKIDFDNLRNNFDNENEKIRTKLKLR